jgi:uncharacterized protein YndB with AHSA1/START domain
MARVFISTVVEAPVAKVWAVAGAFDKLDKWAAPIKSCKIEGPVPASKAGARRRLEMQDGTPIIEEQTARSDSGELFYTYAIRSSPLPVKGYISTVRVLPVTSADHTFVEWTGSFEPDGTDEKTAYGLVDSYYRSCLASLEKYFGG